jgi:hypothetical protein
MKVTTIKVLDGIIIALVCVLVLVVVTSNPI